MEIAGIVMKSLIFLCNTAKQLIVPNKKLRHKIQMTNDRPVYILPLINYNVYWPFIGHLYSIMSLALRAIICFQHSSYVT